MDGCKLITIERAQLNDLRPLWAELNAMHLRNSQNFKGHYQEFTFDQRCKKFREIDHDNIRIELLVDNNVSVGYCICTIEKQVGEIDSIYIREEYRNSNHGGELLENGIKWMKEKNCNRIIVAVAEGNESVFGFYRKYGFYPRMTYLQLKG